MPGNYKEQFAMSALKNAADTMPAEAEKMPEEMYQCPKCGHDAPEEEFKPEQAEPMEGAEEAY